MTVPSGVLVWVVVVPAITALGALVAGRRERTRDAVLVAGSVVTLVLVAWVWTTVRAGAEPAVTAPFEILPGVSPGLRADGLGATFALLAAVLWVPASVYATTYLRTHHEQARTRFVAWFALCLSTTFGVALAADLLTFLLFYELLTVSTYPLVVHAGTAAARAAGRRYLVTLLGGGGALVLGTVVVLEVAGIATFSAGGMVGAAAPPWAVAIIGVLFALGFATKAAVMPLHAWLPAAMVAPTPVSALLHAVAVVKAGVFGFARLTGFVLGPGAMAVITLPMVLAVLAAVTIVVASVLAIRSNPIKRRLAYSTIAHLSFMVLALALLGPTATEGAVLHMVNHGVAKITLFLVAGALVVRAHIDSVPQLDGIGRRMPWTMGAFTVGALSLVGLPPFGGLWSKVTLVRGAVEAGHVWAALVMAAGGVLTAAYLLPIVHRAFLRPPSPEVAQAAAGDGPPGLVAPLCVTAALVLVLGVADVLGLQGVLSQLSASVFGGAP